MHPGHQVVLSSEERDILRWARNASGLNPPSGTDTLSYKKATALEALVGAGAGVTCSQAGTDTGCSEYG
jgi:23S rRNA maturation mini-RNase III